LQSFKYFVESLLSEASSDNLRGSVGGGESSKAIGHTRAYIFPLLSKSQVTSSVNKLQKIDPRFSSIPKEQGKHYDEDAESTHTLGATVKNEKGTHPKGTRVRVTGVHAHEDGKKLLVSTEKHGVLSMASLEKPKSLKRPNISGDRGFSVEKRIAKNLGTAAAGSTGESWDYVHNGRRQAVSGRKGKFIVRGVVKETEGETPKAKAPLVRGESKLDKGKMGQGVVKFSEGKWSISSKASKDVAEHMKKTKVVGDDGQERSLLDHLNTHHSDGIISKGFVARAPRGMSRAYLGGIKANSLHIHHKKNDTGTTFSINDELKGKTNLSHLGNSDLDRLDGKVNVEASRTGTASIVHRPNQTEMKRLALLSSQEPEEHKDLTNAEHASEFVSRVKRI